MSNRSRRNIIKASSAATAAGSLSVSILCSLAWIVPLGAAKSSAHAEPNGIPPLLRIEWTRGKNLSQGFQDSDGGIVGNHLVTVGGFCSGGLEKDNREKPGRYPRGFLNKAWRLSLSGKNAHWETLPNFPGAPRQGLSAANVAGTLYYWGGFSYQSPHCYADGWRLSRHGDAWQWDRLPVFPWPICSVATAVASLKANTTATILIYC